MSLLVESARGSCRPSAAFSELQRNGSATGHPTSLVTKMRYPPLRGASSSMKMIPWFSIIPLEVGREEEGWFGVSGVLQAENKSNRTLFLDSFVYITTSLAGQRMTALNARSVSAIQQDCELLFPLECIPQSQKLNQLFNSAVLPLGAQIMNVTVLARNTLAIDYFLITSEVPPPLASSASPQPTPTGLPAANSRDAPANQVAKHGSVASLTILTEDEESQHPKNFEKQRHPSRCLSWRWPMGFGGQGTRDKHVFLQARYVWNPILGPKDPPHQIVAVQIVPNRFVLSERMRTGQHTGLNADTPEVVSIQRCRTKYYNPVLKNCAIAAMRLPESPHIKRKEILSVYGAERLRSGEACAPGLVKVVQGACCAWGQHEGSLRAYAGSGWVHNEEKRKAFWGSSTLTIFWPAA
ncbi:hypothetical protein DFH08DRAFT_799519 [Mycena albidolilacea]|uniref:Uncharacterized protein n=1 Tax=Mycena albidolilacea TaxID=1033008 RepID=A0AAD7F338_9AGAR|nr:hypothetical protein DFH08DRAFT_799519 [Mycena albidolilacea]